MNHATASPRHSILRLWRPVLLVVVLPAVSGALLLAANAVSDSNRVPAEIAASARSTGVMLCAEGAVGHDADESLWDRIVSTGTFRCTSWRMRGAASSTTTGAVEWPSSPKR